MTNFRLLILDPMDMILGERGLMMFELGPNGPLQRPCKLQREEYNEKTRVSVWVDVPIERQPAHPYANIDRDASGG